MIEIALTCPNTILCVDADGGYHLAWLPDQRRRRRMLIPSLRRCGAGEVPARGLNSLNQGEPLVVRPTGRLRLHRPLKGCGEPFQLAASSGPCAAIGLRPDNLPPAAPRLKHRAGAGRVLFFWPCLDLHMQAGAEALRVGSTDPSAQCQERLDAKARCRPR